MNKKYMSEYPLKIEFFIFKFIYVEFGLTFILVFHVKFVIELYLSRVWPQTNICLCPSFSSDKTLTGIKEHSFLSLFDLSERR